MQTEKNYHFQKMAEDFASLQIGRSVRELEKGGRGEERKKERKHKDLRVKS
jgi:hypothetical protein